MIVGDKKWIPPRQASAHSKNVSGQGFSMATNCRHFSSHLPTKENGTIRDYILVSLLTGGRRGNVESMRWD